MKKLSIEEAVRILENMKVKFPVPRAAETQIKRNAALEMAIKALATDINVGDKDTISRKAAIEALKNDMASLDHIIKGMSANDVRLDAYVSQRNQVNYDIYTINNLPPAQLGTNLAEVGMDCISRQAAIEGKICIQRSNGVEIYDDYVVPVEYLKQLPPAQPAPSQVAADIARIVENGKDMRVIEAAQPTPDQNGDLWITVPDIDKVTCIYVQESKSKFCRIFYEER